MVGGPKAMFKSQAYDLAYLFLDPKFGQNPRVQSLVDGTLLG
jgi:hypothetical protein